jgi:hypothetical protein
LSGTQGSSNPGSLPKKQETNAEGVGKTCGQFANAFSVSLVPFVGYPGLKPWAEISERLRR